LHLVTEGDYLPVAELSEAWRKATGDSFVVDVRKLDDASHAAWYLAKYITKGTSVDVWQDPDAAQEWVLASKGVRTCGTFGSWRGFRLLAHDDQPDDWQPVCSLDQLLARSRAGERWASDVILYLTKSDWLAGNPAP
jgi:hypothetical protein